MRTLSVTLATLLSTALPALADPLPSWNDTASRQAIVDFVEAVTDPTSEQFVPVADRIATFDNDGCLWAEQPVYFQLLYALDRLREKAAEDPSILTSDVLRAANDGDMKGMMAEGEGGLIDIVNISHAGMNVEAFQSDVHDWLTTATHPDTGMNYIDMTYQPMTELLTYLRENEFKTYIVSGGGQDFIRAFAEEVYNIPPEQVVGSEGNIEYTEGVGHVSKTGDIFFIDDKVGKPVGIARHIGKRPIFAAGNSDGDFQMLEYTMAGDGPRFAMLVHHTDDEREFAYDSDTIAGKLVRGLEEAVERNWLIVDMKNDWNRIWAGAKPMVEGQ